MNRITNARLESLVERVNTKLERPQEPWTKVDGKLKANIGNIHISGAYGGVGLHEMMNDSGGIHALKNGYGTKRELETFLLGMLAR